MSTTEGRLDPHAPLWQAPATPPGRGIRHTADETMAFDTELNIPAP